MRSSRALLAAAVLVPCSALAAGCGASGGTITVGGEAPPPAPQPSLAAADTVEVGPGPFRAHVSRDGYELAVRVSPNRATTANRIAVSLTEAGTPVAGARVGVAAGMLTMDMGTAHYRLAGDGTYSGALPAWEMPGRWGLTVSVTPPGGAPIRVALDDRIGS